MRFTLGIPLGCLSYIFDLLFNLLSLSPGRRLLKVLLQLIDLLLSFRHRIFIPMTVTFSRLRTTIIVRVIAAPTCAGSTCARFPPSISGAASLPGTAQICSTTFKP
jgi:hypothetical protein